jgi:predicted Zn-ribbon and HTH transcriptional regulator
MNTQHIANRLAELCNQGHEACCPCGFRKEITVGGNRLDYTTNSPFPFFCESCGLVEANAVIRRPVCPTCNSSEILQYGRPPISQVQDGAHPVIQDFDRKVFAQGNRCPECKQMTLAFSQALWLAD